MRLTCLGVGRYIDLFWLGIEVVLGTETAFEIAGFIEKMYFLFLLAITLVSTFFLSKLLTRGYKTKDLPGGSLGFPLIGETFSFLRALKKEKGPEWINERVSKYGTVFKTSLMGTPTVVIFGQAGNKFVLGSDEGVLAAKQPKTLSSIAGKYNLFELTGSRYKLLKGAMLSFLKPESLQNYVKQMDDLVKNLLLSETKDRDTLATVIFMKKLTFTFSCSILFGIHDELTMKAFFDDFTIAFKAFWSLPLYFPGTVYWNGLRARTRIINRLRPIIRRRKEELSMGLSSPKSDIMSCLLALKAENEGNITEEMIVDNFVGLMIASHDTTSILLSLMVWKMSRDPVVYQKILEEQMGILENREGREEKLTWVDIQKMKYTWRVAQELMRIIPPLFGSFRKALKDTTFDGYVIPKGWQVFSVVHSTHMDKDIFDNPMEFDPSRFENLSKRIPPYAYVPFGGGLHMCIGNEFTRVETLTMVHSLVTLYEWVQVHPEEVITRQPVPYPSMGLPIKIKPRTTL